MDMNLEVTKHVDDTLAKIRMVFDKAVARIEALKPGEKIPATQLAEDLAKEQGSTGPQLYPVLVMLFKGYPGIEVRRGAHGGLYRPIPGAKTDKTKEAVKAESDKDNEQENNDQESKQ